MSLPKIIFFGALLYLSCNLLAADKLTPSQRDFFESKVRPILVESCYSCHSLEAGKSKGGLLLDSRAGWQKGGDSGLVIVSGKPDESRLIKAIEWASEDLQMPPKEKLGPDKIQVLRQWIEAGAPDPRVQAAASQSITANHWAFKSVQVPVPPKVKDLKWPRTPIDQFILAELEQKRLKPAPPADKRTLLRRATFDLTGLPPTAAEIETFLADQTPDAFTKVVDRLLQSPHFGERWGRHWLDLARYADSNGLEVNTPYPNAWRYRDYVIKSFNDDKPYRDFIREQLAGDLLPVKDIADQHEKWIATGFLMLGPKALGEPDRTRLIMDVVDEQIDVTTRTFLGLTVSCARCHDHKFDPIPTRDYYALAGIFHSTLTLDDGNPLGAGAARAWQERPLGTLEQIRQQEEYDRELQRLQAELAQLQQIQQNLPGGIDSSQMAGVVVDNLKAEVTGNWRASNYSTNFVDKNYLHDGDEKSAKGKKTVRFVPDLPRAGAYEVRLAYTPRFDRATNVPVTIHSEKGEKTIRLNQRLATEFDKAFVYLGIFDFAAGTNGSVTVGTEGTKGFVVADAVQFLPLESQSTMTMAMRSEATLKSEGKSALIAAREHAQMQVKITDLRSQAPPPLPAAMSVQEGKGHNLQIHLRGDPQRLGVEAPRGFISVVEQSGALKPETQIAHTQSSGRLELADWIAHPDHPLTSRVMVNRIWYHLMGRGLVDTLDNFGALAEPPTHPELLDFLARRFSERQWSIKKIIREIMLSSVYQMGSEFNPAAYQKDPENRYYWRKPQKHLEAEALRDSILFITGELDITQGGAPLPGNLPPVIQTDALAATDNLHRRSVYLPIIRNGAPEMLQTFDFADPHAVVARRHATSTAMQALFLMNSPFINERAKAWATRLLQASSEDTSRIRTAFTQAFGRLPAPREEKLTLNFLNQFQASLISFPEAERHQRAWAAFCHSLLTTAEFRFVN
ncbi:MAG: DUF1549 domain-containing protein [Verrucomicrobiota bacterium]|nr:DUF1549 domain-containing protein [Verrucomicrobiota bacterium]